MPEGQHGVFVLIDGQRFGDLYAHFNITLSRPQLNAVVEEVNKHRQSVRCYMEKQSGASGRG